MHPSALRRFVASHPTGILLAAVGAFLATFGLGRLQLDESVHHRQVHALARGEFAIDPELTVFPGLHALASLPARLAPGSVVAPRLVLLPFVCILVGSTVELARALGRAHPTLRAVSVLALPVVLPLCGILYTDVPALALVLLAAALATRGLGFAASLSMLGATLLRHPIALEAIAVGALYANARAGGSATRPAQLDSRAVFRGGLVALPSLVFVVGLVGTHGGVLGDAEHHRPGLHPSNVALAVTLATLFFAPFLWGRRFVLRARVATGTFIAGAVALITATVLAGAPLGHPYNVVGETLYSHILAFYFTSTEGRLHMVLLGSTATVWWTLEAIDEQVSRAHATLALLVLCPALVPMLLSELVEPRYAIPFLVTVLLILPDVSLRLERRALWLFFAIDAYLLHGMWHERWFPL